ncbi:MAG: hypothetical protein AABY22_21700 [Nanoarchaeota archaeon]
MTKSIWTSTGDELVNMRKRLIHRKKYPRRRCYKCGRGAYFRFVHKHIEKYHAK